MFPVSPLAWLSLGCAAVGMCSVFGRWLLEPYRARLERERAPSLADLDLHAIVFGGAPADWTKADEREWTLAMNGVRKRDAQVRESEAREQYVRSLAEAITPTAAEYDRMLAAIDCGPGRTVRIPPASEWITQRPTEWQTSLPVISDPDTMFHSVSPDLKAAFWRMKKENRRLVDKLKRERASRPEGK